MPITPAATLLSAKWRCALCVTRLFARHWPRTGFNSPATMTSTDGGPWRAREESAMPTIILSPVNVINFPEGGGHFWVYMQYVQGLRQSGCDVYWLESFRSSGDEEADEILLAPFRARMGRFGLEGKLILYPLRGTSGRPGLPEKYIGLDRSEAESIFGTADLLLNFHYAISPELLLRFRRTAMVDIDPGLLQFWMSRGQLSVPRHDFYF